MYSLGAITFQDFKKNYRLIFPYAKSIKIVRFLFSRGAMVECGRQGIDKTITLCSKQCQNVMTTEIKVKQNVVVL